MTNFTSFAAAGAVAVGCIAAPAAAQYQYPQPTYPQQYPQTYPQQYPQTYPQQTYPQQYPQQNYPGYGQQYGYEQDYYGENAVGAIIDQLLGNRYNVTDRTAVSQCATAAMVQARAQYGGGYGYGYNQGYPNGYNQGYPNGYNQGYGYNHGLRLRVTAITDVERRSNGLRVSGLMSSGYHGQYGYQGGYGGRELSFRCNVDYRGSVTNIRVRPRY